MDCALRKVLDVQDESGRDEALQELLSVLATPGFQDQLDPGLVDVKLDRVTDVSQVDHACTGSSDLIEERVEGARLVGDGRGDDHPAAGAGLAPPDHSSEDLRIDVSS